MEGFARRRRQDSDKEPEITRKLLLYEDVIDLARRIAKAGLLTGERVIVTGENNQWVVLEGNRRICACKLLLSPQLIPKEFKSQFPKITTSTEIGRIEKIDVDVAPDRRSAEHILTLRHTESGVRRWKPVARMRRVKRLLDENFTVDEIAAEYNGTPSAIRKTIREFRLLQLAQQLKGLSASDRRFLENPDLKTNPFTRFFELSGVKEFLGLSFDSNGQPIIDPPRRTFDKRLKQVVRAFIDGTSFDTRTDPASVFGSEFDKFRSQLQTKGKGRSSLKSRKASAPIVAPQKPVPQASSVRPDRFFESLVCNVQDNSIAAVVTENKKINPEQHAISGTYLLRTLMELCLRRLIAATGRTVPGKSDPGLTELVNFSLQHRDVFPQQRMGDVIEAARSNKSFDYLNIVVHQKWMDADPKTLKTVANQLRNFIRYVVQGGV